MSDKFKTISEGKQFAQDEITLTFSDSSNSKVSVTIERSEEQLTTLITYLENFKSQLRDSRFNDLVAQLVDRDDKIHRLNDEIRAQNEVIEEGCGYNHNPTPPWAKEEKLAK